jgi:peptide deformylase
LTANVQIHISAAMALLPLVVIPDPILRTTSAMVTRFDAPLRAFAGDMLETMYAAPGIGLAAIQVAEPIRMLVIDLAKKDEPKTPIIFINPEIVMSGGEPSVYEEGCLSVPDYYADVERPSNVTVRYQDETGATHELAADGLMATCLQHEIDHLNGILFLDHISRLKREMVIRKFKKLAKDRGGTRILV